MVEDFLERFPHFLLHGDDPGLLAGVLLVTWVLAMRTPGFTSSQPSGSV